MDISRALKIRSQLVSRIRDLYSSARIQGLPSDDIIAGKIRICNDTPKGVPQWVRAYVDGYEQALRDDLYQNHLIFGGYVEGVFYSTHSNRPDYYAANGIEPSAYADDGLVKERGHYWKESMPFKGGTYTRGIKPYYTG